MERRGEICEDVQGLGQVGQHATQEKCLKSESQETFVRLLRISWHNCLF